MSIASVLIPAAGFAAFQGLQTFVAKDGKAGQRRHQGLESAGTAIALASALQRHRGATMALLNGDESFRSRLGELQMAVTAALNKLDSLLITCASLKAQCAPLAQVSSDWQRLRNDFARCRPVECFDRHTDLIGDVLKLAVDIADASRLSLDSDPQRRRVSQLMFVLLPALTESIGQARALGSAQAAQGVMTPVSRVRLLYLSGRIESTQQAVDRAVAELNGASLATTPAFKSHLDQAHQSITRVLKVLTEEMIPQERLQVVPSDYFAMASAAIDGVMRLFEDLTPVLERTIETGSGNMGQVTAMAALAAIGAGFGALVG